MVSVKVEGIGCIECAKSSSKTMPGKCLLDLVTWKLHMMVGEGCSGGGGRPIRLSRRTRSDGEMSVYRTFYNLNSEERGQWWRECQVRGEIFFVSF